MTEPTNRTQSQSQYFPEESKDYIVEVPAQAKYIHQSRNPSGMTPMESIQLEGQAYRQISSGRAPWWVTITLWFLLGFPLFLVIIPLLGEGFLTLIPLLLIGIFISVITWRGIQAKRRAK